MLLLRTSSWISETCGIIQIVIDQVDNRHPKWCVDVVDIANQGKIYKEMGAEYERRFD